MARAFLGFIAFALVGSSIGAAWLGQSLFAFPLLLVGLILAVMCAFFPTVSGEIRYRAVNLKFGRHSSHDDERES